MGIAPIPNSFHKENFPKCTGMIWINDESKLPVPMNDGPQKPAWEQVKNSHYMTGTCLDLVAQIKKLSENRVGNTLTNAKGLVLITNPEGKPVVQCEFGEPIPAPVSPLSHRIRNWVTAFLPNMLAKTVAIIRKEASSEPFAHENVIRFLEGAAFVPTAQGLLKASREFSIPNPHLQLL